MPLLIYPELPGLAYNILKRPIMSTLGADEPSPSGDDVLLRQYQNPLWEFELIYEWLYDDATETWGTLTALPYHQQQALLGFFLQVSGTGFLLKDPTDFQVRDGALSVTTVGGTKYSQIVRNMGGFDESILAVNGNPTIYVGGVAQTPGTDYTWDPTLLDFTAPGVSWDGQYITWITNPGSSPVTADFDFYFYCRFKQDSTDFEKFAQSLWLNQKVEIRSRRRRIGDDLISSTTWTAPSGPSVPIVDPGPTPGGPSGGSTTDDMLDWCLMQLPDRASFHMSGDGKTYSLLDTDAAYPAGFPTSGWFWWTKQNNGHPSDVEFYNGSRIGHRMTENGDVAGGWNNQYGYKRLLAPIAIMPRFYTLGSGPITIDSPRPNLSHRTTDCENNYIVGNLGDVRCVTDGPFTMAWGGDVGTQPTIRNDYYYGGSLSSGVFLYKESTFYVKGFGRIAWNFYKLIGGSYQLAQSTINNFKVAGSVTPVFPCGPGKPWFV
jgi:Conserved hypothetical protein 2217 (DUF2460)